MPDNKKHHFVSQFYLRNFGVGNSICVFNIPHRRHISRAAIAGQCQRPYLYGSDNKKEAELRELEGAASAVIRTMLSSQMPPERGGEAHRALVEYLSVQLGRTPNAAAALQASQEKMYRAFAKDFASRNDFPENAVEGISPPSGSDPQLVSLGISEGQGVMLLDLEMRVLKASARAFITSDLPVVLYNQWSRHYRASGVRGLTCSGLLVLVPLSPSLCLLLFDAEVYAAARSSACIELEECDVTTVNAAQLLDVDTNLYYLDDIETRSQIDTLPLHWSRPRAGRVRVQRARSEETNSTLLYFFEEQADVSLKFRFLRQRERAKRVPTHERGRSWRDASVAEARKLGLDGRREKRPDIKPGTTWRVVGRE
jgi:hypothetical protein